MSKIIGDHHFGDVQSVDDYVHYKEEATMMRQRCRSVVWKSLAAVSCCVILVVVLSFLYYRRYSCGMLEIDAAYAKNKRLKREKELISAELQACRVMLESIQRSYDQQSRELDDAMKRCELINSEKPIMESEFGKLLHVYPCFLKPEDWMRLDALIKKYMHCFYSVVSDPHLSAQEKQVCVLVRLGCSTQAIVTILSVNGSSAVSNVKRRINKKLFGKDDASTLYDNVRARERDIVIEWKAVC